MDLRTGITGNTPDERCAERRTRVEKELELDLARLKPSADSIGHADEKNCEQMIGHVPLPVGIAGPLTVNFSSKQSHDLYLPLATTEGALVASVNRGCKAVSACGGAHVSSVHHGISRSIALKTSDDRRQTSDIRRQISEREKEWVAVAESTSAHLKIMKTEMDVSNDHLFLTLYGDTDEAMGMNMITIAAQVVGEWIEKEFPGVTFVTVAGNVDSDKKPSARTHQKGRGYEVTASVTLTPDVIRDVLKSDPDSLLTVAEAKLKHGSAIAGAIGHNLHAGNIIAAIYLATGQDAAHVAEGSLTDTTVTAVKEGVMITVRCPAIIVGVRGGGTTLPAQSQCLKMLLARPGASGERSRTTGAGLHPKAQLAESIGAAVLAGEISLLAAQASHTLASAHQKLGRAAP